MKLIILSLAILFVIKGASAQTPDVLHYRFHIGLNDGNDTILGKAEIKLVVLQKTNSVSLSLANINAKGKGMLITDIDHYAQSAYRHENDKLVVTPGKTMEAGDTLNLVIHYKGIPADGLIISKTKYGKRSFFADNWPDRGHNWLPCHDVPYDKASVEFVVTAPQHYQVVANGIQIEETNLGTGMKRTHWREDVPISTKVMVIGVADFAVSLAGVIDNCIPVYSWVYPEDRDKGFYDYAQAMEVLPFFIKNVGPYGYKKLANVQSKTTFGGLENANTIFYSEGSVGGKRKSESLIVHEIAHQWFGNMATEKTFAHLWLSEGFATYMTILYMENKYGRDTAVKMLQQDRREVIAHAKTSNRPVVDSTHNYMELLNANSYQKGGWILHMLRSELGDTVFWLAISRYYRTYAGKTADTDDLRKIFESVSGKKLETFFRQWLYTPGIPQLDITWSDINMGKQVSIHFKQLQDLPFHLKMDVNFLTESGIIRKTIEFNTKEKFLKYSLPAKTIAVEIDPHTNLLIDWKIAENKYGVGTGGN